MKPKSKPADELFERYGGIDGNEGYNLAASVWGHRLRTGQHWMEYLLEFFNVLAGYDFQLGRGITHEEGESPDEYKKFHRIGLRRFVFYDEREKTRHPHDDEAKERLHQRLKEDVLQGSGNFSDEKTIQLIRTLFRSFSAVEAKRSWYAKSLFPAHKDLLFWEATRKGATTRRSSASEEETSEMSAKKLDEGVRYDQRNFFARGGELYYLILSAGTRHNPEWRKEIERGLTELVQGRNQALGELASIIESTWENCYDNGDLEEESGPLGWIPDPDAPINETIAEDVKRFLEADLDPLEALTLLAHLICFHLSLYIYSRADRVLDALPDGSGKNGQAASPFLVDMLTSTGDNTLRQVSATLFKEKEAHIEECGRRFIEEKVERWCEPIRIRNMADSVPDVFSRAENYFGLGRLRSTSDYDEKCDQLITAAESGELKPEDFQTEFTAALQDLLMKDFRKNFLPVHRKLTKSVQFVAPHKGPSARYVLGDNLLKAITLSNATSEITFEQFLDRMYRRYKIVVGDRHARESGLFKQQRINSEYYLRNRAALLERMKLAGLAQEFSDATAMVKPSRHVD
jgi:DNA-binding transcriptional ArsR family regulator